MKTPNAPVELINPQVEFNHGHGITTRAALDKNGQITGKIELIAPLYLLVEIDAQATAPTARRFLTDRGMMYQDAPEMIAHLLDLLLAATAMAEAGKIREIGLSFFEEPAS